MFNKLPLVMTTIFAKAAEMVFQDRVVQYMQ